ncbi:MAG: hypothetical protein JNM50_10675 [Chromatiales bacterium]|jgi:hypothetical protein|nr:hypothetical protein [Chromatiales bacterium]
MQPEAHTDREYVEAFRALAARIAASLAGGPATALPVHMYVAGGAALHFYTGSRVSADIDAVFSRRVALPEGLETAWRDESGRARLLYFDTQYNDTFGLMHEDAHDDSLPLSLEGIDSTVLDVRLLTPLDLAVSKLGRFSSQDQDDIAALARKGLITAGVLTERATEALAAYVGNVARLRGNIAAAARLVASAVGEGRD